MSDNNYAAVPLSQIDPDAPLCADVYVKVNEKYILFKNKDDHIDSDKYNFFLAMNVKSLYISKDQLQLFVDWLKETKIKRVDKFVEEIGEENRDIAEKREEIKEAVFNTFADEELSNETVNLMQKQVEDFISEISSRKLPTTMIAKLVQQNEAIAEHSVNVANISVFLAMSLGHGHQFVLENVYLGALFHDYAKAKIPENILNNPGNVKYSQAIQDHPQKSAQILKKATPEIPEQVLRIIVEHHEQFNGQGYPKGKTGEELYELSKIVSIANRFDNILTENKNNKSQMYNKAIKFIEYDRGKEFDPEITERAVDALKLAYGNYVRERKE